MSIPVLTRAIYCPRASVNGRGNGREGQLTLQWGNAEHWRRDRQIHLHPLSACFLPTIVACAAACSCASAPCRGLPPPTPIPPPSLISGTGLPRSCTPSLPRRCTLSHALKVAIGEEEEEDDDEVGDDASAAGKPPLRDSCLQLQATLAGVVRWRCCGGQATSDVLFES